MMWVSAEKTEHHYEDALSKAQESFLNFSGNGCSAFPRRAADLLKGSKGRIMKSPKNKLTGRRQALTLCDIHHGDPSAVGQTALTAVAMHLEVSAGFPICPHDLGRVSSSLLSKPFVSQLAPWHILATPSLPPVAALSQCGLGWLGVSWRKPTTHQSINCCYVECHIILRLSVHCETIP